MLCLAIITVASGVFGLGGIIWLAVIGARELFARYFSSRMHQTSTSVRYKLDGPPIQRAWGARQIVEQSKRPDVPRFDSADLRDFLNELCEERGVKAWLHKLRRIEKNGIVALCTDRECLSDTLDQLDGAWTPGSRSLLRTGSDRTLRLKIDGEPHRVSEVVQTDSRREVPITIEPSSSVNSNAFVVLVIADVAGDIKIRLRVKSSQGKGGTISCPTVLVLTVAGKPEIDAEGVDLYFIGDGQAIVNDGAAHMYEGSLAKGKYSEIFLYGAQALRSDHCRIHVYDKSKAARGMECELLLYPGGAQARSNGAPCCRVEHARYGRDGRLIVKKSWRSMLRSVQPKFHDRAKPTLIPVPA